MLIKFFSKKCLQKKFSEKKIENFSNIFPKNLPTFGVEVQLVPNDISHALHIALRALALGDGGNTTPAGYISPLAALLARHVERGDGDAGQVLRLRLYGRE